MLTTGEELFQSWSALLPAGIRSALLPDGNFSVHTSCGELADEFSYRAIGVPYQGLPLPASSQLPFTAMRDASLEQRLERSAVDFLGQRDLVEPVLKELMARLRSMWGVRLFCTNSPECTVTVHDLRIRVLEPLVMSALQLYHDRMGADGNKPAGGRYILSYRPEDPVHPQLPRGITLTLRHTLHTSMASNVVISFEEDSSFLTFGPQTNLFAREDECKLFLDQTRPIPLDPSGRSHGAQAMLNKLAWRMQSAVERNPETGEVEVPVRFGLMMSTHFVLLAESVVNLNNPQQSGLLYTRVRGTCDNGHLFYSQIPSVFKFDRSSVALIFLAAILDNLLHTPGPSSETLDSLFGTRKEAPAPPRDHQSTSAEAQPSTESPVSESVAPPSGLDAVRKRRTRRVKDVPTVYPDAVPAWYNRNFVVQARLNSTARPSRIGFCDLPMEAVTFEVVGRTNEASTRRSWKPSRRLSHLSPALLAYLSEPLVEGAEEDVDLQALGTALSDLHKVKLGSVPRLEAHQFVGKGGFASVTAGQLEISVAPAEKVDQSQKPAKGDAPRCGASLPPRKTRRTLKIPTDQPVVIKLFDDDAYLEAGIRESIFYETIFPLLPKEARVLLPHYYGTYRSSDGRTLALIMGYAGYPIPSAEKSNDVLRQEIREAYKLFEKYGIDHSDRELRNVMRHRDGSLCLIDWNLAVLNFHPYFRKPKMPTLDLKG